MSYIITENLQWFWLAACIVFIGIESLTMGLTTIWFAAGSFVMIFLSYTHMPFLYQVALFLAISALLLIFTRPFAIKKLKMGKEKTNADGLVGKKVLIAKKITEFEKGEVKINGIVWAATTADHSTAEQGTEAVVCKIEGTTLVVSPAGNTAAK